MPLYTPLSGSWLNMTESIQRIIAQRVLGTRVESRSEDHAADHCVTADVLPA